MPSTYRRNSRFGSSSSRYTHSIPAFRIHSGARETLPAARPGVYRVASEFVAFRAYPPMMLTATRADVTACVERSAA